MSIIGKISTLFFDKEKKIPLFPRTKIKAVSDDNGTGLESILDDMKKATLSTGKRIDDLDVVVAQGISGIWMWRKWASGIAECWGRKTVSGSIATPWGAWYNGILMSNVPYPFNFTKTPIENATARYTNASVTIFNEGTNNPTRSSSYSAVRPTVANGISVDYDIYVVGQWK